MRRFCFVLIVLLAPSGALFAQYDSTYISVYDGYLTGRFLTGRKHTGLNVRNDARNYFIRYRPNKTLSAGFGASYRFLTLNISTGIIPPSEEKGRTRNLDLQINRFGRRFATDILYQYYRGFYIPGGRYAGPEEAFYVRPDIAVTALGVSHQYIFNHRKFSYRAAFQQTEVQKKSAGSFTLGFEVYMGRFAGDSSVIPRVLIHDIPETLYRMKFVELGPNIGYMHTWVYRKYFFTAGGSVSLNLGLLKFYEKDNGVKYSAASPNSMIRLSTGYNAGKWSVNLLFVSRALHLPDFENRSVLFNAGNVRMNLVYRFRPGKQTRRFLRGIEKVDKKLKG